MGKDAIAPRLGHSPTVLLLIDFINPLDFDGAEGMAAAAVQAADAAAALKARVIGGGGQCIYANDNYGTWRSNFPELWRKCRAMGGAPGRMAGKLKPRRNDLTVLKPRHSAFYCTPLDLMLGQLKPRRLILCGLATDNCVLFSAMDAYLRGYRLWVPADCTAAESEQVHRHALEHMKRVLKANVSEARASRQALRK
jgi:nicotinamidase-related amidase